ncbi:MAG: 1-deoxy-D-xylulose-5-phosphate synthase, partial [Oscillospiraceae bacterium]|nr:1-deoxy-D-xylulose-5-phosphate synthase [Oscillospiraceae bacterium]
MTENTLLKNINSPAQLKTLPVGQIPTLCSEIRDTLVSQVNAQGGHLSSNLGVVELTVALHRIFNSPQDKILWDVGHQ